jgi:hypothetical protein
MEAVWPRFEVLNYNPDFLSNCDPIWEEHARLWDTAAANHGGNARDPAGTKTLEYGFLVGVAHPRLAARQQIVCTVGGVYLRFRPGNGEHH